MLTDQVAIATIAWARSVEERQLLDRSLKILSERRFRVAVAERGPSAPALVSQVKAAFQMTAGWQTPFVLYTEPDKEDFFKDGLMSFLERAIQLDQAGIVLASRSEESLQSFPAMQRRTERFVNEVCGEMTGVAGDYSYGPFLIARALLPCIQTIPDHLGWGWRFWMFLTAHRQRFRIVHLTGNYFCPPDQQVDSMEEHLHRLRQLSQNALGLTEASRQT